MTDFLDLIFTEKRPVRAKTFIVEDIILNYNDSLSKDDLYYSQIRHKRKYMMYGSMIEMPNNKNTKQLIPSSNNFYSYGKSLETTCSTDFFLYKKSPKIDEKTTIFNQFLSLIVLHKRLTEKCLIFITDKILSHPFPEEIKKLLRTFYSTDYKPSISDYIDKISSKYYNLKEFI